MNEPSVEPDIFFDDEPEPYPPVGPPSSESLADLLSLLLVGSKNAEEVGCKALLLAAEVRHPCAPRTVRSMAERMQVSPSEAHRRGTSFREKMARFRAFHANGGTGAPRV